MSKSVIVIGGGVIGLSVAFEMRQRGWQVSLVERGDFGRQSSWAGAGILSPAHAIHSRHPLDRLAGQSSQLHREWANRIQQLTRLDVGFWACGGCYLARTAGEQATLIGLAESWQAEQIECEFVDLKWLSEQLGERFQPQGQIGAALWTPVEWQVRNPWLIRGLVSAVSQLGGNLVERAGTVQLQFSQGELRGLTTESGWHGSADLYCVTSGAWTFQLLQQLKVHLPTEPIRGQMALFQLDHPLPWIINEGTRYLVPRPDGHVLVGSTMEEAGFDCRTTEPEIAGLLDFAQSLIPELNRRTMQAEWAGLRPASCDGLPYVGWIPGWSNLIVATGHLRSGLQLAPATARFVADMSEGQADAELSRLLNPARLSPALDP